MLPPLVLAGAVVSPCTSFSYTVLAAAGAAAAAAVAGLSKQQMAALQGSPSSMTPQPHTAHPADPTSSSNSAAGPHTPLPGAGGLTGAVSGGGGTGGHASLLRSLPVAVLADPAPSRPQSGVVLSVAPLLGARPYTDPQVGKWLHVHVRPSVRGLLRIIKVGDEVELVDRVLYYLQGTAGLPLKLTTHTCLLRLAFL
jgi:hypothetical protein